MSPCPGNGSGSPNPNPEPPPHAPLPDPSPCELRAPIPARSQVALPPEAGSVSQMHGALNPVPDKPGPKSLPAASVPARPGRPVPVPTSPRPHGAAPEGEGCQAALTSGLAKIRSLARRGRCNSQQGEVTVMSSPGAVCPLSACGGEGGLVTPVGAGGWGQLSEGLSGWYWDAVIGDPNKPGSTQWPRAPRAPWADAHSQVRGERLRGVWRPCKWQRLTGPRKSARQVQELSWEQGLTTC